MIDLLLILSLILSFVHTLISYFDLIIPDHYIFVKIADSTYAVFIVSL